MVICKYYLQGTCKFGQNCKFEHEVGGYRQSVSILRQPQATPAVPTAQPQTVDIKVLVNSVTNDMVSAEKGGQWLLSSYAPFKDKPCFPGFEDRSFEEVRHGYYEAMKNGTLDQYTQQLRAMLQEAAMRIKALQNPSPEIVGMIKSIYDTPVAAKSSTFPTSSGFASNTSVFAQQQQPATTFSFTNASKSILTQNSQAAAPPSYPAANQSIFGGQTSNFSTNQTNTSIFASQPQSMNTNIFSNQMQSTPPTTNIFASQPQQNQAFSVQQQQSNYGNVFANSAPQSQQVPASNSPLFSGQPNPTQTSNVFNQNSQGSVFGGNVFGQQNVSGHTNSVLGRSGGQNVDKDASAYSMPQDLSESDLKAFDAPEFEFGKIPELPPTIEMCR